MTVVKARLVSSMLVLVGCVWESNPSFEADTSDTAATHSGLETTSELTGETSETSALMTSTSGDAGSTDAGSTDADTGTSTTSEDDGFVIRGIDQFHSLATDAIVLEPPAEVVAGDVILVVILRDWTMAEVTAPEGFELRLENAFACGPRGAAIEVFLHVVDGSESGSFVFGLSELSVASAVLLGVGGISRFVEVSTNAIVTSNPIILSPLQNGPSPAWGIAAYTGSELSSGASNFTIPTGMTRIVDSYNIALYGIMLDPGAEFFNDSANMLPEGCGFAYAAVHPLEGS